MDTRNDSPKLASRRSPAASRRQVLLGGVLAGAAGALSLPLMVNRADASESDRTSDIQVLNNALMYEHAAIWAYNAAASKLSGSAVGQAVKAIALENRGDHEQHREALAAAVRQLGGMPVAAQASYDISTYLQKGEGNLESDKNIAILALALETDAAIAYTSEVAKLKTPALISAAASIGSNEASHATLIRTALKSLGMNIKPVPSSFVSAENRSAWILTV